ncbi:hypothetical protein B0H10DRAFT_1974860 [Mycena sp. CBHHK59/15]|nr:hypothetical protein B0H10DRAFT_1974860 [Mycena sp. CBHHK59/15]
MPQMSSRPSFDIGHAAPLLNSLSLSDEALESTAYFPKMGYSYFFQFTLCPFVHALVRAVTHDFTELDHLPAYSATEGHQIRTWLLILLYHFGSPRSSFRRPPTPMRTSSLLEASSETLLRTRCRGKYVDYDENGCLVCSTLLRWDDGFGIELDLATSVAHTTSR